MSSQYPCNSFGGEWAIFRCKSCRCGENLESHGFALSALSYINFAHADILEECQILSRRPGPGAQQLRCIERCTAVNHQYHINDWFEGFWRFGSNRVVSGRIGSNREWNFIWRDQHQFLCTILMADRLFGSIIDVPEIKYRVVFLFFDVWPDFVLFGGLFMARLSSRNDVLYSSLSSSKWVHQRFYIAKFPIVERFWKPKLIFCDSDHGFAWRFQFSFYGNLRPGSSRLARLLFPGVGVEHWNYSRSSDSAVFLFENRMLWFEHFGWVSEDIIIGLFCLRFESYVVRKNDKYFSVYKPRRIRVWHFHVLQCIYMFWQITMIAYYEFIWRS